MVLAVLLRGFIPVGYMPNPAAGPPGASLIILCDSVKDALSALASPTIAHSAVAKAMPTTMPTSPWIHHHHEGGGGHAGHSVDAPCVFAAVAALAVVLLTIILVLPSQPRTARWALAPATCWPRARPSGPWLARGPPAIFS